MNRKPDQPQEPWNVLIFMAADNSLKEESVFALTEIKKAASSTSGVNVVVQLDSGDETRRFDFSNTNYNRFPGRRTESIRLSEFSKPVNTEGKSEAELLKEFLDQGLKHQTKNLVVLSGHGSGAVGDFLPEENPPESLSIPALRQILEKTKRKIDILGMDSCLMSTIEVCYELRTTVNYLIGSEGFTLNTGWPYQEILTTLTNDPGLSAEKFACDIVRKYMDYYEPYTDAGVSVDISACDLQNNLTELKEAVTKLAAVMTINLNQITVRNAILLAHWKTQSYKLEQYVDLFDFCDLLRQGCDDQTVQAACNEVCSAVELAVRCCCYSGAAFQYSHGLSIYFPWSKSDIDSTLPFYMSLMFDKETGWSSFLEAYGNITQRPPRTESSCKSGKFEVLSMNLEYDFGPDMAGAFRSNLLAGTKSNLLAGTKSNLLAGTKVGHLIIPLSKNPPNKYLKFTEECGCAVNQNKNGNKKEKKAAAKRAPPTAPAPPKKGSYNARSRKGSSKT